MKAIVLVMKLLQLELKVKYKTFNQSWNHVMMIWKKLNLMQMAVMLQLKFVVVVE